MDVSGILLRDERTVLVRLNSTVIAGPNAKRFRLTVLPVSANPVYLSSSGPASVLGGALVIQGTNPVVYGEGGTGRAFDNQISAIASVDLTPVTVIDEFFA